MKEGQGRQQNEKTEIFFPNPEYEKRLHPHALKRFNDWKAEFVHEVPQLDHLDIHEINVDINTHLNDDEQARAAKYRDNISKWLRKCLDIGNGYSRYSPVYDTSVISDMYGLKRLVKVAYEQKAKVEKKKAEAEEKDRQWEATFFHVFPLQLSKDAGRYLSNDDQEKLLEAAGVAIRVYLKQGDSYLDNYKTFDYRWYLRKIKHEKEKEQIRLAAEAQAQAFSPRLDQGLKEIERKLSPKKEAPAVRFKRYCSNKGENRYLGESFTDILASDDDKKGKWKQGYIPAAEEELPKFIPEELRDFILTKPTVAFFLLPSANYSHCGVPCLDFYFDVFAVVTITVSAQVGPKKFNGPRSYERYQGIIARHLIPELGNIPLPQLRSEHLQHLYSRKLSEGLSALSVKYLHTVLHKALQTAIKWGLLTRNVSDGVDVPRARHTEMQTWEREDVNTFLEAARETQYYALFHGALYTGMRRSELLALRWSDIDLFGCELSVTRTLHQVRDGSIVFGEPKSARSKRLIKLTPQNVSVLRLHREKQLTVNISLGKTLNESDLVFCHIDGTPLLPSSVTHAWEKLVKTTGVKRIRLHDARHSHASLMLKQGIHPKIVQERLGHSSIQITLDTYNHVAPGLQEAAAARFDEALKPRYNESYGVAVEQIR